MLNSEVIDLMMGRLGKRQATTIRTTCIQELNQAIRELERGPVKPWFLEDTITGVTVANQEYIDLPADFLMEIEEGTLEVQSSVDGWIELTKVSREKLRDETKNAIAAFPEGYAIWGTRFLFGPVPDAVYNYRSDSYKRTPVFAENGSAVSNPWLIEFFDYTVYKALIVVARDHIQSDRLNINFTTAFNTAKDSFMREVEERRVANETLLLNDTES